MRLIEVFCLGFINQREENYILYLDRDRSYEDIAKTQERFPEAIIQNKPYPVLAREDTYERICINGGKLLLLNQKIPKCREHC